jgi:hypothetical protein
MSAPSGVLARFSLTGKTAVGKWYIVNADRCEVVMSDEQVL